MKLFPYSGQVGLPHRMGAIRAPLGHMNLTTRRVISLLGPISLNKTHSIGTSWSLYGSVHAERQIQGNMFNSGLMSLKELPNILLNTQSELMVGSLTGVSAQRGAKRPQGLVVSGVGECNMPAFYLCIFVFAPNLMIVRFYSQLCAQVISLVSSGNHKACEGSNSG